MTGPAPYSLQWHKQIAKRAASTAERDHDDDGFPDDLGSEGQTLPPGVEFRPGAEEGILEIWDTSDSDNAVLIGSISRDVSYFRNTVETGSASYKFGGKHTLGSAGEQAGFLNLISLIFYAPSIWEGTSQDGTSLFLSRRRIHGKRGTYISEPNGYKNFFVDYDMIRTPPVNMVAYSASSVIESYAGEVELHVFQGGEEISAMTGNVISDGNSLTKLDFKYPLYLEADVPIRYVLTKPDGTIIRAKADNSVDEKAYYEAEYRTWKEIQPVIGEEIVKESIDYINNVHYITDTTAGPITLSAESTTDLLNFRVTTLAMVDATNKVIVNLGTAGNFEIVHPNASYSFLKDDDKWCVLNEITGESVEMSGTDKTSTDNKDFFSGGAQASGDTVVSGELAESDASPVVASLTADAWTDLKFTTVAETITDKPADLSQVLWTSDKFNLSQLAKGDSVEIEVSFTVTPNVNNASIDLRFVHTEDSSVNEEFNIGRLTEGAGEDYNLKASFVKSINHDDALTDGIQIQVKSTQAASASLEQIVFTLNRRSE
ncbi:hypothetical protein [Vibrio phage BONAISHI]|nr:hypothetical protein [Vibrio phage BONAISHI]